MDDDDSDVEIDSDSGKENVNPKRIVGEQYSGDSTMPVIKWTSTALNNLEIGNILLKPQPLQHICTSTTRDIAHNATFLVNTSMLKNKEDIKFDDMGRWKNNGKHSTTLSLSDDGLRVLDKDNLQSSCDLDGDTPACVELCKVYYQNKSSPSVVKTISWIEDNYGKHDMSLVQYLFKKGEHDVVPVSHGNSKRKVLQAFIPTKKSTKDIFKTSCEKLPPKKAYHHVLESSGGIKHARAASDLPRNLDQASCFRRGITKSDDNANDSVLIVLQQCKRQHINTPKTAFIREVVGSPDLRCVLASDRQLNDLMRFCTNPVSFSIFNLDPTFNLGNFNLTVTTYRNTMLLDKKSGKHPVFLGPLFIHQKKTFDCYNYFVSKMIGLNPAIREILCSGTDGEAALVSAIHNNLPFSIHLRCFKHFKSDCKELLKKLNIPEAIENEFLCEIFGKAGDGIEGLLDATGEDDFEAKSKNLEEKWNEKEMSCRPPGQKPKFHSYIKSKVGVNQKQHSPYAPSMSVNNTFNEIPVDPLSMSPLNQMSDSSHGYSLQTRQATAYPCYNQSPNTQTPSHHPYVENRSHENSQPWQNGKPFFVCRIHGNISRCNGCRGTIDKQPPPYDLVIMHEECHYYPHPSTRQMVLSMTPKPKYYHFQLPCLRAKHPTFSFKDLVPGSFGPQLEESHFQLIQHYSLLLCLRDGYDLHSCIFFATFALQFY